MKALAWSRISRYAWLSLLLGGLLLGLVGATFREYGISADEQLQQEYGRLVLRYVHSGGRDDAVLRYGDLIYYGGLFEAAVELLAPRLPWGEMENRHLLTALAGLAAYAGCWYLGYLLAGAAGGFWSLLLLAVTGIFYGHMFNNSKDIPFAAAYAWSLIGIIRCVAAAPALSWRPTLGCALAIGLAMALRVSGVVLLGYLALALLLAHGWRGVRARAGRLAVLLALVWLVLLAGWPWAQQAPVSRPLRTILVQQSFPWHGYSLFAGRMYWSPVMPWDYLPRYFVMQVPEFIMLLFAGAVLLLARQALCRRCSPAGAARLAPGLLLLGVLFPAVWVMLSRAVLYDTIRHLLFLLPPLAALAAWSWVILLRAAGRWRPLLLVMMALLAGGQALTMARRHPYQYLAYNYLAGGLPAAAGRYELDYWGHSYAAAVRGLADYLRATAAPAPGRPWRVFVAGNLYSAAYYFPPTMRAVLDPRQADFFISDTRFRRQRMVDAPVLLTIACDGVPLNYVKDLRDPRRVTLWADPPFHLPRALPDDPPAVLPE